MKTVFYSLTIIFISYSATSSAQKACHTEKLNGNVTTYLEQTYQLDDILLDKDSSYIIDAALNTLLDSLMRVEANHASMLDDLEEYKLFYVLEDSMRAFLHDNGAIKQSYTYCKVVDTEPLRLCNEFKTIIENDRVSKYTFINYVYQPNLIDLRDTITTIVKKWDSSGNVLSEEIFNDSVPIGKMEYAYTDDCSIEYLQEYAVNDTTGQFELSLDYSIHYEFDDKGNVIKYNTGNDFDYVYRYLAFDEYGNWTKRILLMPSLFRGYYPVISYRTYAYD